MKKIASRKSAVGEICGMLFIGNSSVNPLIYYLRIPAIKKHIMAFLRMRGGVVRNTDVSLEMDKIR